MAWTHERLNDFAQRVDARFDAVDARFDAVTGGSIGLRTRSRR